MSRIEHEKEVVSTMIELYCRKNHSGKPLCDECNELQDYAMKRLDNCKYGEKKSFCNKCETHCYKKDMRER